LIQFIVLAPGNKDPAMIRVGQFLLQFLPLSIIPANNFLGLDIKINTKSGVRIDFF